MSKLSLNSIPTNIFKVNAAETADNSTDRAKIVSVGRVLNYEYARRGCNAVSAAKGNKIADNGVKTIDNAKYKEMNEKFQASHMLYAAKKVCEYTGEACPETMDEFRRNSARFYGNSHFYAVLQGIYQEIVSPILPAVFSEAVSVFADTVSVGLGETYSLTVGSNDIPIFQDSAWGAGRSVPRNRAYTKEYTLNPTPRTAAISAKWIQLVSAGFDFGRFFANLTAGVYAKTLGLWNATMAAAASDTSLVPTGLTYTFNSQNWVALVNKLSAVNNTSFYNHYAFGNYVPLSKVLPTQTTGSANVTMDAALAELLGVDYIRSAYLGEFMGVKLMPLQDAVVPGTQNGNVTTIMDQNKIWIMSGNGRKPMTIAVNDGTPMTIEMQPDRTGDFEIGINMTISLDTVATFVNKVGLITI